MISSKYAAHQLIEINVLRSIRANVLELRPEPMLAVSNYLEVFSIYGA